MTKRGNFNVLGYKLESKDKNVGYFSSKMGNKKKLECETSFTKALINLSLFLLA